MLATWLAKIAAVHPTAIELGLDRIRQVATQLDLLHFDCPIVTVAGTNGKGSMVAALNAIYRAHDYQVGCLTSPHLWRYNERIVINDQQAADADLCEAFALIDKARGDTSLTYFEFTTLAALWLFKQQKLDVILLEVGLGGRLDAVNVVDADVAVITSIGWDHMDYLGDSLEKIAKEKAGIFRQDKVAVLADDSMPSALEAQAQALSMEIVQAHEDAAMAVAKVLQDPLPVDEAKAAKVAAQAKPPGRCQWIPGEINQLFDVSHNTESVARLAAQLPAGGRKIAVFSALTNKPLAKMVAAIADQIQQWFIAPLAVERAASLAQLQQALTGQAVTAAEDLSQAYQLALKAAQPGDTLVIFGSFHTVAALLAPTD